MDHGDDAAARRAIRGGALRGVMLAALATILLAPTLRASPWLHGIHWYGDPASGRVELMTGNRPAYCLETVMTHSDIWWSAGWQRQQRFLTAVSRGHTLIVRIQRNWGENTPFAHNLSDFDALAQSAAAELADVCRIWQVGNEPNLLDEWGGQALSPAEYAAAYRRIRTAIRSVASPLGEQLVLVAPVSPGDAIPGVRHTGGNEWLAALCAELSPNEVDGFALHGYGAPWHSATDARRDFLASILTQLAILSSFGFADKPALVTEWARAADPPSTAQEAASAAFLNGSLADVAAWNAQPGAHPVSAMCWFIYPPDSGAWQAFSIESFAGSGPPGADHDLFDAFRHAADAQHPSVWPSQAAAAMLDSPPAGVNAARSPLATRSADSGNPAPAFDGVVSVVSKWTSSAATPPHHLTVDLGLTREVTGFVLRNAGAAGENPAFNTTALTFETADGAAGPWHVRTMLYNATGANVLSRNFGAPILARGVRLRVLDAGVDATARIPEFEVYALRPPGDMDNDGDVDAADFTVLRFCLRGPGFTYASGTTCRAGDADADADVDMHDLADVQRRFGG
ncbi:MAG: discoidin domain-containing protein [Phycisphaerales bacterium]|nr:discoidin domain-containing protein [Phycisphaerales bacterium]